MYGFKLSTMLAVAMLTVTILAFLGLAVWNGAASWLSSPVGWAPHTGAVLASTKLDDAAVPVPPRSTAAPRT